MFTSCRASRPRVAPFSSSSVMLERIRPKLSEAPSKRCDEKWKQRWEEEFLGLHFYSESFSFMFSAVFSANGPTDFFGLLNVPARSCSSIQIVLSAPDWPFCDNPKHPVQVFFVNIRRVKKENLEYYRMGYFNWLLVSWSDYSVISSPF